MRGGVYKNGGRGVVLSINLVYMIEFIFYYTHISIILRTIHPLSVDQPRTPQLRPYRVNYAACTSSLRCYWRS